MYLIVTAWLASKHTVSLIHTFFATPMPLGKCSVDDVDDDDDDDDDDGIKQG